MTKAKGVLVAQVFSLVEERFGKKGIDRLKEALGSEVFDRLHPPHLSTWYQFHDVIELWKATDKHLGRGDLSLLQEVIERGVEWDLTNVYKIFFKIGNPVFLLRRGTSMWKNYYSDGRWEVVATSSGVHGTLLDFPDPHPVHCFTVLTWLRKFLSFTRVSNPRIEMTACRANGDAACIFEGSWE